MFAKGHGNQTGIPVEFGFAFEIKVTQ